MKKIILSICAMCLGAQLFAAGEAFMNENSNVRMQNFLSKIKQGKEVTVIALGGSITTGFSAKNPGKDGWAGLTGQWIADLGKENNSKVNYYNQGVSGTDSAFAVARLEDHILSLKPDLLLLEFAMNDQWLEPKVRNKTYEAIIRRVLEAGDTAILVLFVNERRAPYPSAQSVQQPICDYYHLPCVSWKECVEKTGKLSDFEKYFDGEEGVHPNTIGHGNIASHIINKIKIEWDNLPSAEKISKPEQNLPKPLSDLSFVNAKYYANDNLVALENTGWEATSPVHSEWVSHGKPRRGWQTNNPDAEICFEVEGTSVGITYCESDQFRNAVAWVTKPDGSNTTKVSLACMQSSRKGYYGWAYKTLVESKDVQKYIVHIGVTKRAPKTAEGKYCNITGILVGGEK